jgi:branched-chain amino acid transport system substrate-binding protein
MRDSLKALSSLLLSLIFAFPSPTLADPPIKIGVISGLSGLATKWNHYQNNGVRLAQEELNASGTRVEIVFEDSQTTGSKAVTAFNKLVDIDKVDAVFADDFGFAVAPVIPVAQRKKKLFVANSLSQDEYCKQSKGYFFSLASQLVYLPDTYEQFFLKHPEIKRAAMFVFDDPEWGHTYQRIWSELAKKHGITITDSFVLLDATPDFRTMLAKALAKKPDLLLLAHEPITFSKAAAGAGFTGPILAANNYLEVLDGNEKVGDIIKRVVIADPMVSPDFRKAYETRFKEPAILEAYTGYEGIKLIARALKENRAHPEVALRGMKYEGVGGEIDFTTPSCAGNFTRWGLFSIVNRGVVPLQ